MLIDDLRVPINDLNMPIQELAKARLQELRQARGLDKWEWSVGEHVTAPYAIQAEWERLQQSYERQAQSRIDQAYEELILVEQRQVDSVVVEYLILAAAIAALASGFWMLV